MTGPGDPPSIARRCRAVRERLRDLIRVAGVEKVPLTPEAVEDISDRFELWCGDLGALHEPPSRLSLEARLGDSPEMRVEVSEQVEDLHESLQDLIEMCLGHRDSYFESNEPQSAGDNVWGSMDGVGHEETEDGQFAGADEEASTTGEDIQLTLGMATQCLKALFRVGTLVRRATPRDCFQRALQRSQPSFPAQFDTNYVLQKYPKLDSRDKQWLAARLGVANTKRRQFIKYSRDNAEPGFTEDLFVAKEEVSSKATTFDLPSAWYPSIELPGSTDREDDTISLMTASTTFDTEKSLKPPGLADLAPDDQSFECPICFTLQSFQTEKAWKVHAYRDLKAYVCTVDQEGCKNELFSDRTSWFDHELKRHRSLFACKLCGCPTATQSELKQHITTEHNTFPGDQLSILIELGRIVPSQLNAQDCPFCDDWARVLQTRKDPKGKGVAARSDVPGPVFVSLKHFKRHVATHQEHVAIFSVPKPQDSGVVLLDGGDEQNYVPPGIGRSSSALRLSEDSSADGGLAGSGVAHAAAESSNLDLIEAAAEAGEEETNAEASVELANKNELKLTEKEKKKKKELEAAATAEAAKKAKAEVKKWGGDDKEPIKFKDAVGRKFSFPFRLACKWETMQDLIIQAFAHVDVLGPHVRHGHFDLEGPEGELIRKEAWDTTVQPGWQVTMKMWPNLELHAVPGETESKPARGEKPKLARGEKPRGRKLARGKSSNFKGN